MLAVVVAMSVESWLNQLTLTVTSVSTLDSSTVVQVRLGDSPTNTPEVGGDKVTVGGGTEQQED